jgi:hypothetical protein
MNKIIFEDGKGNQHDESGEDVIQLEMEVDETTHPIENVTDLDMHWDLKPPEKMNIDNRVEEQNELGSSDIDFFNDTKMTTARGQYKSYKNHEKEKVFFLVKEKGETARAATIACSIKIRTAQGWVAEDKKDPQDIIMRQAGSGRPVGRPPILTEERRKFMVN